MDENGSQERVIRASPAYEFEFPSGGKIVMGEQPEGPTLYFAMQAAGALEPSLVFTIDPLSFQSLLSVRVGPGDMRTVPLDKLIGGLRNLGSGSLLTGR